MPRSAARITLATNNFRLPFEEDALDSPKRRQRGGGRRADRCAGSRRSRARGRPALQRRARGVGRNGQDAGPRRPLRQSASRRCRSVERPGDHVHPQGCRRNARAHHRQSDPRRGAGRDRAVPLARPARSDRRHRDQHDRRVLPVAAARVPARSRSRPRLLDGRRHRGSAPDRRIARSRPAHLSRRGPR